MRSRCTKKFWKMYNDLPPEARQAADRAYEQWGKDPGQPGLSFKATHEIEDEWYVRINDNYRAVCIKRPDGWLWYGIGDHDWFDRR